MQTITIRELFRSIHPTGSGWLAALVLAVCWGTTIHAQADCVQPPSGLIAWWPGNGDANDVLGTYHGTLQGGATATAPGIVGSCFTFDGTNGYVTIPDAPALQPANLTIECWVRFNSLNSAGAGSSPAGQQYLIFKQNSRTSFFEGFALTKERGTGGDRFSFAINSAAGQTVTVQSSTLVATGVWYHVAGVRGSNFVQLLVNGQLERQTNITFAQDYGSLPLYFGSTGQGFWDHKLLGNLDDVALYDRALTAAEVATIYAAGASGKCLSPTITAQPASRTVGVGANVAFSVAALGSTPLGYQWLRNGTPLVDGGNVSGAGSPALNLANVQTNDSGDYQVVVTNSVGSTPSSVAILNVDPNLTAPVITNPPASQTALVGTNVVFTVAASGAAPLSYQWRFNGTDLFDGGLVAGATSSALSLSYVLPAHAGDYSVVVSNSVGATTSAAATLTVQLPTNCYTPPSGLIGWWTGDGNARDIVGTNHGTLQGGASADAPGVVGQGFRFDGTNTSVMIPDSPELHPPVLTIECWVEFRNLNGFGNTYGPGSQYMVFKNNSRDCNFFEAFALSKDRNPDGDAILWEVTSVDGELIRIDSKTRVTTNTWYHVVAVAGTNYLEMYVNGVMETNQTFNFPLDYGTGKPLMFGSSGESCFDRKLDGVLDEVALYDRPLTSDEVAALYANAVAGKCKGTNGLFITTHPQNQIVPPGANATFTSAAVGGSPVGYQWQLNGSPILGATSSSLFLTNVQVGGSYRVVVTNASGAQTSGSAMLTVMTTPSISNQPVSLTIVAGSPANFSVSATGGGTLTYQWRFTGTNLDGETSSSLAIPSAQLAQAGDYSVTVSNAVGFAVSDVATLTVLVPAEIVIQPTNLTVVAGAAADFFVAASGTAPFQYQWEFNGTNLDGAFADTFSLTNIQPAQAGDYRALVSNAAGTATSAVATLTVLIPPTIIAQPVNATVTIGDTVNLSVTAEGTAPLNYQWQFNGTNLDGALTAALALTNVQTGQAGEYSVIVTNIAGLTNSAIATLTVLPPLVLLLPAMTTNSEFTFILSGGAGRNYAIEGSTNLEYWAELTVVSNATGQVEFVDTTSSNSLTRFYRARILP